MMFAYKQRNIPYRMILNCRWAGLKDGNLLKRICGIKERKIDMNKFIMDLHRFYPDAENYIVYLIKDYRILYLYCWRKIQENSKLAVFFKLILKHLRKHYHIEIPYSVIIGGGFSFDHAYNITINSKTVIGKNVTMYKGSTIGIDRSGVPVIGDNVYIGINSTIVGGVTIGNDVLIAPNTFVNFNVPDHSVVLGNPGVIHHKTGATNCYLLNCLD